jgi:hypothetical protein
MLWIVAGISFALLFVIIGVIWTATLDDGNVDETA